MLHYIKMKNIDRIDRGSQRVRCIQSHGFTMMFVVMV